MMDDPAQDTPTIRPAHPAGAILRDLISRQGGMRRAEPGGLRTLAERPPERAATTALGRAAERSHALPVQAREVRLAAMSVPELPELLPERPLLAIVEDPRGRIGFVALCPQLLAAMIEMQALGRVTSRPAEIRRPTRTDAAIAADFVNALLEELGRELAGTEGTADFGSFRYVAYLDDARPLSLMLEDGPMRRLSMACQIGGGQRQAEILIGLPDPRPGLPRATVPLPAPVAASAPEAPAPPRPSLAAAVQLAPVTLSGVLCRRSMTLRALRSLQPGALLPLPQNALEDIRVETLSGQLLARGRLGENDGFHAIKLRPADVAAPDMDRHQPVAPMPAAPPPSLAPEDLDSPDPFRVPPPAQVAPVAQSRTT